MSKTLEKEPMQMEFVQDVFLGEKFYRKGSVVFWNQHAKLPRKLLGDGTLVPYTGETAVKKTAATTMAMIEPPADKPLA